MTIMVFLWINKQFLWECVLGFHRFSWTKFFWAFACRISFQVKVKVSDVLFTNFIKWSSFYLFIQNINLVNFCRILGHIWAYFVVISCCILNDIGTKFIFKQLIEKQIKNESYWRLFFTIYAEMWEFLFVTYAVVLHQHFWAQIQL